MTNLLNQPFIKILQDKYKIPKTEIDIIIQYLILRQKMYVKGDNNFGVVFVTSKYCNLSCKHCAVDAKFRDIPISDSDYDLSTKEIIDIFTKLHTYLDMTKQNIFFMFGGGEPTLRGDFRILLKEANSIFGRDSIGFCTNGTFLSADEVLSLAENVGLLEVSLDCFEDYHNKWRTPTNRVSNPYSTTLDLIKKAVSCCPDKLEVASVVTKHNIKLLPKFAIFLKDIGVKNYSVHRPVPIGRMFNCRSLIPSIRDYLLFFAAMARVALDNKAISLHLHHSLESIYSAVILGKDIHFSNTSLGTNRHSIGIDPKGFVHFDPWAILSPFSMLSPGTLCDPEKSMVDMFEDQQGILNLITESKKANVRCRHCDKICSGGMRITGIIDSIAKNDWPQTIIPGAIIAAISSFDPACPVGIENK